MPISNSTDRFNGVIASLAIKVRCVVAAESNVAALTGISNPYSGINIVDLDRILLVAQTDAIENGVWDVHEDGLWTRAFDWDGNRDVEKGSTVWAGQSGGLDKLWQVQTAGVILPGSTAQTITILFDPTASAVGIPNPLVLPEIAGAGPDVPGEGQIWVRDDSPNVLIYTDDEGTDFVISSGGGGGGGIADGTTNNATLRWDGSNWVENTDVLITSAGQLQVVDNTAIFRMETTGAASDEGTTDIRMNPFSGWIIQSVTDSGFNGPFLMSANRTGEDWQNLQIQTGVDVFTGDFTMEGGSIYLDEVPAALADRAGYGQVWVRDDVPNTLMFTDDAGNDHDLTAGGGGGTPAGANEEIQYNDNGSFGASVRFRWDVSESSLDIDVRDAGVRDGAIHIVRMQEGAVGLRIESGNGNTTFHDIWQDYDPDFESSWRLQVDSTSPLRLLTWLDDPSDVFIQFQAGFDGLMRFGGNDGSEKTFIDFTNDIFAIRNSSTLYIEEITVGNPEVTDHGQIWVRDDAPNTLMFTDDAGTDFVIGGAAAPTPAQTFVMVTPISISLGGDDVFATISDGTLSAASATFALIKCFAQIAPTGDSFATQAIHLRETGSAIAKATSNRAAYAAAEDNTSLGASADTNDAWVELDGNQDFDILQDQVGTGTSISQAWIVGYMA